MRFGDVLRELLEDRGVTQKELAQELCLAVSTIGNYTNNQREPDCAVLKPNCVILSGVHGLFALLFLRAA